eukprot:scaffold3451_cov116-Isochrysis_galbana.AAC.16
MHHTPHTTTHHTSWVILKILSFSFESGMLESPLARAPPGLACGSPARRSAVGGWHARDV